MSFGGSRRNFTFALAKTSLTDLVGIPSAFMVLSLWRLNPVQSESSSSRHPPFSLQGGCFLLYKKPKPRGVSSGVSLASGYRLASRAGVSTRFRPPISLLMLYIVYLLCAFMVLSLWRLNPIQSESSSSRHPRFLCKAAVFFSIKNQSPEGFPRGCLELLPGFGPGTSSLPRMCSTS